MIHDWRKCISVFSGLSATRVMHVDTVDLNCPSVISDIELSVDSIDADYDFFSYDMNEMQAVNECTPANICSCDDCLIQDCNNFDNRLIADLVQRDIELPEFSPQRASTPY
jgi:hypothetical protein